MKQIATILAAVLAASTAVAQPRLVAAPSGAWICNTLAEAHALITARRPPSGCGRISRPVMVLSEPVGEREYLRIGLIIQFVRLTDRSGRVQYAPVGVRKIEKGSDV